MSTDIPTVKKLLEKDIQILDCRPEAEFIEGFIKGAVHIAYKPAVFMQRVTHFLNKSVDILLISPEKYEADILKELKEAGYHVSGTLNFNANDLTSGQLPLDMIIEVDTYEFRMDLQFDKKALVIDVRNEEDFETEHVQGAMNIPVFQFTDPAYISKIDDKDNVYLHCNGGTRALLAASVLKKHGFHNIRCIKGGFKHIRQEEKIPLSKNKSAMN